MCVVHGHEESSVGASDQSFILTLFVCECERVRLQRVFESSDKTINSSQPASILLLINQYVPAVSSATAEATSTSGGTEKKTPIEQSPEVPRTRVGCHISSLATSNSRIVTVDITDVWWSLLVLLTGYQRQSSDFVAAHHSVLFFRTEKRSRRKKVAGGFKESVSSTGSYLPAVKGLAALAVAFCLQHCHVLFDHARKRWNKLLGHGLVRIAFNLFSVHPFFVFFSLLLLSHKSSPNWFDHVLAEHNATDCFSFLCGIPSLCILL